MHATKINFALERSESLRWMYSFVYLDVFEISFEVETVGLLIEVSEVSQFVVAFAKDGRMIDVGWLRDVSEIGSMGHRISKILRTNPQCACP